MSKQQGLKSTNLTKIFIYSENELWEWLNVNHARNYFAKITFLEKLSSVNRRKIKCPGSPTYI